MSSPTDRFKAFQRAETFPQIVELCSLPSNIPAALSPTHSALKTCSSLQSQAEKGMRVVPLVGTTERSLEQE